MKFGTVPREQAAGCILAHSLQVGPRRWKKGRQLRAEDLSALREAGIAEVVAARLDAEDLAEDRAAERLAQALAGAQVDAAAPYTGRCNLFARSRGLAVFDPAALQGINRLDEALTVATVGNHEPVEAGRMLATVKVIPFGVAQRTVEAAAGIAASAPLRVAPFRGRPVGLILSRLPQTADALLEKTRRVVDQRLEPLGGRVAAQEVCHHDEADLSEAVGRVLQRGAELVLIVGASAITDRRDVVPAAVIRAGGEVLRFGMPVDPGNLLLLGRHGEIPVVGLPGCARSPKLNGADWVLNRIFADLPVDATTIADMGIGGLLQDIPGRPHPRERRPRPQRRPRLGALVLAAGHSRRMGKANKLLQPWQDEPLIRHAARAVVESGAAPVYVVTGHQAEAVADAVADLPVLFLHNPDHAEGLASSLRNGLRALPEDVDGVLVALGDMPRLAPQSLRRLLAAFSPAEGRSICVPTYHGKRGNPVLLGRELFPELLRLEGDRGARRLIARHEDRVAEVEVDDPGILLDVDTPTALDRLRAQPPQVNG